MSNANIQVNQSHIDKKNVFQRTKGDLLINNQTIAFNDYISCWTFNRLFLVF